VIAARRKHLVPTTSKEPMKDSVTKTSAKSVKPWNVERKEKLLMKEGSIKEGCFDIEEKNRGEESRVKRLRRGLNLSGNHPLDYLYGTLLLFVSDQAFERFLNHIKDKGEEVNVRRI